MNNQCASHIETSQLICSANELAGLYIRGNLIVKGLNFMRQIFLLSTGRKLNVHKTFRRDPEPLLNVLWTFNTRPVSMGLATCFFFKDVKPICCGFEEIIPAVIYLFQVNKGCTKFMWEICSKLTMSHCFGIYIIKFEQISRIGLTFPLLTLK